MAKHEGQQVKQASPVCLSMLAAREALVVDDTLPVYLRMYSWRSLVKVWATLRFDDMRGIFPQTLSMDERGLSFTLVRSKSTGPGKRHQQVPCFVSAQVWLREPLWLHVGLGLWQRHASERDYLLLTPSADMHQVHQRELKYNEAVRCTRLVNRYLQNGESALLEGYSLGAWSEHSERATLPSLACALGGFADSLIDSLGRWSPSGAQVYNRSHRMQLHDLQERVARAAREGNSRVKAADDTALCRLSTYLLNLGVAEHDKQRQLLALAWQ
eukprot:725521-Amphidinium_carterae.1